MTFVNYLNSLCFTLKQGLCVSFEPCESKTLQFNAAFEHVARPQASCRHNNQFLHRIVTDDEKWYLYVNKNQRSERVAPREKPRRKLRSDLAFRGICFLPIDRQFCTAHLHRVQQNIQETRHFVL